MPGSKPDLGDVRDPPKIANYPFTTDPQPRRGEAGTSVRRRDVPGPSGASQGKGLGHDFLRHVERCSTLVHMLDCATEEPGRDPVADLAAIEEELAAYGDATGAELVTRPRLIALNKIDVPAAREMADLVKPEFEARGYQVFEISAATGEGTAARWASRWPRWSRGRPGRPPGASARRAGTGQGQGAGH
jgi:GTP-binding protein